VRKASRALRRVVPAARGRRQAVQFAHEDDVAAALHRAATAGVEGTYNVATADWLSEDEVAAVSGGRVVRLPFRALLRGSEVLARLRLLDFGADRAVFLNGPSALSPERAERDWGWRPARSSAQVLGDFLAGA
jgi:UDP-glucose 4-epimerase